MQSFARDLRFGFRNLVKTPGFTSIVVLTLALGIGANTAIFSIVHGVLLKPLDFEEPEQLLSLWEYAPDDAGRMNKSRATGGNYFDWKAQSTVFADMSRFRLGWVYLDGRGRAGTASRRPCERELFRRARRRAHLRAELSSRRSWPSRCGHRERSFREALLPRQRCARPRALHEHAASPLGRVHSQSIRDCRYRAQRQVPGPGHRGRASFLCPVAPIPSRPNDARRTNNGRPSCIDRAPPRRHPGRQGLECFHVSGALFVGDVDGPHRSVRELVERYTFFSGVAREEPSVLSRAVPGKSARHVRGIEAGSGSRHRTWTSWPCRASARDR